MTKQPKDTKHCETCSCAPAPAQPQKQCKHRFDIEPSFTIRTGSHLERVWVCQNKNASYCHESRREVTQL